jgi:possible transposase
MPGVGVRTAARILLDIGDASQFPTTGRLTTYAGFAPATRRSGISIHSEFPTRSGNKHVKRALFLSAFTALKDPTSKAYYDRKRAQGKKHNAALIYLSHQRCDVLFAMIKNQEPYQTPAPSPQPSPMPLTT